MEQRFSILSLGVRDLAASTAFYERLGWTRSGQSNDNITFFQAGGVILGLYPWDELARDAAVSPNGAPKGKEFHGFTVAHNARSKDEVDAVLAEAAAAGAEIARPARDAFWGGYSGYFADPDGHLWEVAWNPFFPVAPNGSISLPD